MKHVITFKFIRETKGAVRYDEVTPSGDIAGMSERVIGGLYIRKSAMPTPLPTIVVTIEG